METKKIHLDSDENMIHKLSFYATDKADVMAESLSEEAVTENV